MLESLIGLTDEQMDTVARTAGPLGPRERARFLLDVAQALQGREINDDTVARACAEARRQSERT